MTVEITGACIKNGFIRIEAVDVSEENLQRMERVRDDGFEKIVEFIFDSRETETFAYLRSWLKRQKATKGCVTYGQAVQAVVGTITTISKKYRSLD